MEWILVLLALLLAAVLLRPSSLWSEHGPTGALGVALTLAIVFWWWLRLITLASW